MPPCRAISRGQEVRRALRKILTANLPPFYRFLPHPKALLDTSRHLSFERRKSFIRSLVAGAKAVFCGGYESHKFPTTLGCYRRVVGSSPI